MMGKWYCCEAHGNQDPEANKIKEMKDKLAQGIEFQNDVVESEEDEEEFMLDL